MPAAGDALLAATSIGTSMSTGPGRGSLASASAFSAMRSAAPALSVKAPLIAGSSSRAWSISWWL